jgi:hypothetical protein
VTIETAELIWLIVGAYLFAGALFALYFALRGAALLDPAARGSSASFRLLLIPGAIGLWPVLLMTMLLKPGRPTK